MSSSLMAPTEVLRRPLPMAAAPAQLGLSLFWRTFFLLALLLAGGVIAWVQTLRELVLPLVSDFAKAIPAASKKRLLPGATKSLQMSIDMVTSVLSKYAAAIAGDGDFGELTRATFVVLSECEAAAAGVKDKATVAMIQERVKTLQSLPSLQEGGGSDDSVAANGAGPAGSPTTSPPATTTTTVAPPTTAAAPTAPTTAAAPTAPAANGIAGETENNVASLNQEEPPTCQQS